jgi:hypothetical protein
MPTICTQWFQSVGTPKAVSTWSSIHWTPLSRPEHYDQLIATSSERPQCVNLPWVLNRAHNWLDVICSSISHVSNSAWVHTWAKINCTLLFFARATMPEKSSLFLRPRFHAKEPVLHRTMVTVYRTGFHLSIYCIALASTLPLRMLWKAVHMIYNTEHSPQSKAKLPKLGHVLSQKKAWAMFSYRKKYYAKKKKILSHQTYDTYMEY